MLNWIFKVFMFWGLVAPSAAMADVRLYEHCNYGGKSITLSTGYNSLTSMANKGMANDTVSSVRITGNWKVVLYDDYRFLGKSKEVTSSISCLQGFNDMISSAHVFPIAPPPSPVQAIDLPAVNFVIGSDPQLGYYPRSVKVNRTIPSLLDAGKLARNCTDCSNILVIAGDLVMDNADEEATYGDIHKRIEATGVKVFDGVGNHDNNNFADEWVSFDSLAGLYRNGTLPPSKRAESINVNDAVRNGISNRDGWGIYSYSRSLIDNGIPGALVPPRTNTDDDRGRSGGTPCGTFRFNDAYYCVNNTGYYYSVALYPVSPNGATVSYAKPSAFLVQMHNAMRSATAVRFLQSFGAKVRSDGYDDVPVIIIAHQNGSSGTGYNSEGFDTEARSLNLAAILLGHYECTDRGGKQHGHCDYKNTLEDVRSFGNTVQNRNGAQIQPINTNAFLHNIFWMVSVSPRDGKVALRRINRGDISDIDELKGTANTIGQQMDLKVGGRNLPTTSGQWYICDYLTSAVSVGCSDQRKGW